MHQLANVFLVPSKPTGFIDNQRSPETVSWDNPFPTFTQRLATVTPGGSRGEHGFAPIPSQNGYTSNYDGGARPQTANSKGSYGSGHSGRNNLKDAGGTDSSGSHDHQQQSLKDSGVGLSYDKRRMGDRLYQGAPLENLEATSLQGRHSEDNRLRPSVARDIPPTAGYERSRTMPAAISEVAPESGLMPAEEISWREPGAVSGYYGPKEGQYISDASANFPHRKPPPPPKAQSDENSRWGTKDVARPVQTFNTRHPDVPEESRGEILDTYQEEQWQPYTVHEQRKVPNRARSSEEEMPNFPMNPSQYDAEGSSDLNEHLHLYSQGRVWQSQGPVLNHREGQGLRDPRLNSHAASLPPRSQSQPGLKEDRRPIPPRNDGFDFDVPGPHSRRPATSADNRNFDSRPRPMGLPNRRGPPPDPRSRAAYGSAVKLASEARQCERTDGPDPRRPGHDIMSRDGQRTPSLQRGRPNDVPMRPPDTSSSPQATRGPTSPPQKPLPNPDALPSHPAPVRPGLLPAPQTSQHARPTPIRQYNSAPTDPVLQSVATRHGVSGSEKGKVNPQDLARLKQKVVDNPSDSSTQILLAQKLVNAAETLIDERADPNTKKRIRDKYQADALKIVKKLSAICYPEADFFYADCYSRGALGLQSDIKEAFILYQKAAKANHAQAAYRVAVCCELGQEDGGGTKRDAVKAMQWYKRAATLGDVAAMYKIGVIQLKGLLGQPKEPREAIIWLKRAAERADNENPHALHELVR